MSLLLGCIADDHTGATDLANNLVRAGMRTVQVVGVPGEGAAPVEADAVVVALKTRTIAPEEAVAQSLAALAWLRSRGAEQIYFKVCSTFDSTPRGNIGPVTEALMEALGATFTIATPAFPDNGRAVFKGHLFVGDVPLGESGMKDHPLTPMTDSNLVRVMQAQCRRRVGLVERATVAQGPAAIEARMRALEAEGVSIAIVDAIDNDDLFRLGPALARLPLVVAGSGVAIALPANAGLRPSPGTTALPPARGAAAIVSGSCSQATNRQVAEFIARGGAAFAIDPLAAARGADVAAEALAWARQRLEAAASDPVLVHSTAAPEAVRDVQRQLGAQAGGALVEQVLATVARRLVDEAGVGRLVVAGGETSGACVEALGIERLRIGPQIDSGVPWCHATSGRGTPLHLALKSGNFGGVDFFSRAFTVLTA
jgi:uncharacterized protein YgbK (DUF1537 family)